MAEEERIQDAVEEGEEAFWAAVAQVFPEAESGDLDPGTTVQLKQTMERAVRAWVDFNVTPSDNGHGEG
jgi:hypothetical protein